ncbi:restriction endonuclease subunit S [Campylobacter concisus]|uniref:restriction endonuclease subunit S n=1 Tax=Campylobacter concisus TaxID=199 RepID=UPI0021561787|nr:restriction endonuclease subunit S [Campylobacter concisus]
MLKKDSPSRSSIVNQRIANLEREFKTSGGKFKEFRLDEIFEICGSKTTPKLKLEEIGLGKFPYVTTQATSNGIAGFYNFWTEKGNCITIDSAVLGTAFYQKENFSASDHVEILRPKFKINEKVALYFATLLNRMARVLDYSYGKKRSQKALKNEKILLPTLGGKINFSFMEKFIEELDAYLRATGLKNYELTDAEKSALAKFDEFDTWGGVAKEFNLKKLFGSSTRGKRLKSSDRLDGNLPFVTAGEADMGISAFISNDVEIFKENTITIDMFGSSKYRNYKYGADDHVAVVHTENLPKHAAIYVATAIHKVANAGQFSYARNFYAKDADELNILLPVFNGEICYEFMNDFIKAIEKLVIKDVVLWADKKIEATKKVVNKAD